MDKRSICVHQTAKISLIRIHANMDIESSEYSSAGQHTAAHSDGDHHLKISEPFDQEHRTA